MLGGTSCITYGLGSSGEIGRAHLSGFREDCRLEFFSAFGFFPGDDINASPASLAHQSPGASYLLASHNLFQYNYFLNVACHVVFAQLVFPIEFFLETCA